MYDVVEGIAVVLVTIGVDNGSETAVIARVSAVTVEDGTSVI